jgi:hypothetical protein
VTTVPLSPVPSEAVYQLNQLVGRKVHINLTDNRVDTAYVSSASAIGSKGTDVDGPVASFRDIRLDPRTGPTYTRYALVEIVSVEPIEDHPHASSVGPAPAVRGAAAPAADPADQVTP